MTTSKRLSLFATLLLLLVSTACLGSAAATATQAHASHILVDTEVQADELLTEINKSKNVFVPFARLAREHSKCPSAKKGGDLGTFGRGQMVKEFDEVVFNEEIGVVHKVKTQFGWHLVLISTRSDGTEEPPSELYILFRNFMVKASPFMAPLLLVVIMVLGNRSSGMSGSAPKARASHILVKTEAEADKLHKEILAAADPAKKLAELAKSNSTCPSSSKGGDLGSFGRGQMVPAFDKVVFEEEVGKVHKVQTQFGWHIILCTERTGVAPKKSE
jgi:parvulin-like peptidyl-prolyl isomerase